MGFKVITKGKVTSHVKMIGGLSIDLMTITGVRDLEDPEPGYAPEFMLDTKKLRKDGVMEIGASHCVFATVEDRAAAHELVLKAIESNAS